MAMDRPSFFFFLIEVYLQYFVSFRYQQSDLVIYTCVYIHIMKYIYIYIHTHSFKMCIYTHTHTHTHLGTSLVVQWLRICLVIQGHWFDPWARN